MPDAARRERRERRARCAALLDEYGISHTKLQPARTLSGGQKRRLEIARALIARSGGGDVFHAVRDRRGIELYGVVGVHRRAGREYEIGYWFAARARGKGIATEAVRAVVAALGAARPDCSIVAECHPDNERSRALLRRVGFVSTGRPGQRPGRMLMAWRAAPAERIDVC